MVYRRMPLWAFIAIIISTVLVNIAATLAVIRLSERYVWCDLVSTLDERNRSAPPANEQSARVARAIHDLRAHRLHC